MRNSQKLALAIVVLCGAVLPLRAGDKEDALEQLDKAIKAHGGEEGLTKAATLIRKGSGIVSVQGKDVPFREEIIMALPDKFRFTVEPGPVEAKARMVLIVSGDKGWQDNGVELADLDKSRIEELHEEANVLWAATLVPLKKGKDVELSTLSEIKVDDHAALGIKVVQKGHTDLKMYFDKKTNLLFKIARKGKEAGVEVNKEYVFSEYKPVDGVLLPHKRLELVEGKKFMESKAESYAFPRKIEAATFEKPK